MTANILVYDVGSTYTKASAFLLAQGRISFLCRGQFPTTLEDVMQGVTHAREMIESSGVAIAPDAACYATCSAAGGLRMIAMGYMPRVTAKAAKEVAMCAGARVLEVVCHEDAPEYREEILREIRPNIVLLAGGTDGGDVESVVENARIIAKVDVKGMVILAGNRDAQREAAGLLDAAGIRCVRVANIMPTVHQLNVKPSRQAIHTEFIKQITKAKGLDRLISMLSDKMIMPTPGAVLLAGELLAKGSYDETGADAALIVDVGGATTDIHSMIAALDSMEDEKRGLIVNNEKQFSYRTVEGNLGLRVSATGIVESVGAKAILRRMKQPQAVTSEELEAYAERLEQKPDTIAETPAEQDMDYAMTVCAVELAMKRHAGFFAQEYDPVMGTVPGVATGRDLRGVRHIIAVGGVFAHAPAERGVEILKEAFSDPGISLLPEQPSFTVDSDYILYALGAIGQHHPDEVMRYMKENIIKE